MSPQDKALTPWVITTRPKAHASVMPPVRNVSFNLLMHSVRLGLSSVLVGVSAVSCVEVCNMADAFIGCSSSPAVGRPFVEWNTFTLTLFFRSYRCAPAHKKGARIHIQRLAVDLIKPISVNERMMRRCRCVGNKKAPSQLPGALTSTVIASQLYRIQILTQQISSRKIAAQGRATVYTLRLTSLVSRGCGGRAP